MFWNFLNRVYLGNTVLDYLITIGIFVAAVIAIKIFSMVILNRLKKWAEKTVNDFDDFIVEQVEKTLVPIFYISALFPAKNYLIIKLSVDRVLDGILITLVTFYAVRGIIAFINYTINVYSTRRDPSSAASMKGINAFVTILVWGLGLVFLLDNLGYKVSTIIAGLGIGGIAIALAAQAVLGDMFSYFSIIFDKPFQIGDFIIAGSDLGTVEKVGIKTTRVRALSGEEIIFPNTDITSTRVHNYKSMQTRRIVFSFGVTYGTEFAKVKEIPGIVKNIIDNIEDVKYDRAHFKEFGDFSLNYEVVYIVQLADYAKYMDIQQAINFGIHQEFEKRGIEFAFPTQTLYLFNQNGNGNGDGKHVDEAGKGSKGN